MNKKCYTAFVTLAVMIMLTVTFLPHHHHNGAVCTSVEYCDEDNRYNDEHTGHESDHTQCMEKSLFIVAKSNIDNGDINVILLPLFLITDKFLFPDLNRKIEEYSSFYVHLLYKSADICSENSRRGPPSYLA